jgi:hypothetical protein
MIRTVAAVYVEPPVLGISDVNALILLVHYRPASLYMLNGTASAY